MKINRKEEGELETSFRQGNGGKEELVCEIIDNYHQHHFHHRYYLYYYLSNLSLILAINIQTKL